MNQPRGLLKLLKLDNLIHTIIDYVETRIDLIKAEAKDNLMKAMRAAAIYGSIAILGLFFVFFLSMTLAWGLNSALNSNFWGFAIVTGIYLIALITLFSLRNSEKVKMMFGDGSVAFLSKDSKEEEEEKRKEEERKRKEDIERIAAIRHKEAEVEQERATNNGQDRAPASKHEGAVTAEGRPANINIEKKD